MTKGKILFKLKLNDKTQTSTDNSVIIHQFCKLSSSNCICNTTNIIGKLTCICGDDYIRD